jgi:predicted DNA-binding WGR domain protein
VVRRFTLVGDGSDEFFEIGRDGGAVTMRSGRAGTPGETEVRKFDHDLKAEVFRTRVIARKKREGYVEEGAPTTHIPGLADLPSRRPRPPAPGHGTGGSGPHDPTAPTGVSR